VRRKRVRQGRFGVEIAYVALITALAVVGMTAETRRPLLAVAALLALPCGLAALGGLYALTGVFNWAAAGGSDSYISQGSGGCDLSGHCWSQTTGTPVGARGWFFSTCIVLLFAGAAAGNVLLLQAAHRPHGHRDDASPDRG
jgi:hypothetical protein